MAHFDAENGGCRPQIGRVDANVLY